MSVIIRKKEYKDCKAVQEVITKAWQQTYKGIINDEFLDNLSLNEHDRIEKSRKTFDANDNHYVLEVNNKIVGFMNLGIKDDQCGELYALYILKEYKGNGYGKELFNKAKEVFKNLNCKTMIVGCLKGNKSNEFYKHMGAKKIGERYYSNTGEDLLENVYSIDIGSD